MDFIGRQKELRALETEYGRDAGFVVIYGRRRVGKTRLIKQFIQDKDALYFLASNETEEMNMQRFACEVASFAEQPEIAEATYGDWRTLLRVFAKCKDQRKKVLVIDELPYLMMANSALSSILQYAWDEILSKANVMLVLCGSHTHMMLSEVLADDSPLYGRRTAQIKLKPLSFAEMQEGFATRSFYERLQIFSICGGVPKYLEFFDRKGGVRKIVEESALETAGFLYDEPRFLLAQDTRSPMNHYSLLHTIAQGNHKPSIIANKMQRPQNELSPYLKILEELGYIERRVPATERNPDRSKMGLYFISDALFRFWFTYVQPFEGELEMGNRQASLDAMTRTFAREFVPFAFEEVSRQTLTELCLKGEIEFSPSRIGAFWDRKSSVEIDVCASESQGERLLLGECKLHERRPFSHAEYLELKKKCDGAFQGKDLAYVLFSQTGFDSALEKSAKEEAIVLVDKCRLVR